MSADEDRLWTAADLARFLRLSESTVLRKASMAPQTLPPRVATMRKQRWVPEVCLRWVEENSVPVDRPRKPGRPRRKVEAA